MNALVEEWRPLAIFLFVGLTLAVALVVNGTSSPGPVLFSILQYFATIGPVALGLGLTMIVREFDISVGSTMTVAGCVAIIASGGNPYAGALCGISAGAMIGFVQGMLVTRLRLSSISVSLGVLITLAGLAYVITNNQTIPLNHPEVTAAVNAPLLSVFSFRSLFALGAFAVTGLIFATTRIGSELTATGSDRAAAATAGVRVDRIVISTFVLSGALAASSGIFLTYGLSVASPGGLTDVLVPSIAASIIGGVSLTGGRGSPLGIALGALTLCMLNAGLNALGVSAVAQQIVLAAVLFTVAIAAAPRLYHLRLRSRLPGGNPA